VKIAVVTEDGRTISQHFSRASLDSVFTVKDGKILHRELRDELGHRKFALGEQDREHHHQDHARGHGYGHFSIHKILFFQVVKYFLGEFLV
jgi:hypothetical protein